jgi:hypothetical protein
VGAFNTFHAHRGKIFLKVFECSLINKWVEVAESKRLCLGRSGGLDSITQEPDAPHGELKINRFQEDG